MMMKNFILASAALLGGLSVHAMDLDSITAESNRQIEHTHRVSERMAQAFGHQFDDDQLEQELASLMGEDYVPQTNKMTEDEELEAQILAMSDNGYSSDPELADLEREVEEELKAEELAKNLSTSEILNSFVMVEKPKTPAATVTPSKFWSAVYYLTFGLVK